jgi:hypothetical protein
MATRPGDLATAAARAVTEESRSRALRHPLWLGSLALLVVNDHLLKGAGWLPGWLTGKLSDFAGMIVAPVLLVVVLRARHAWARAAACALVAAIFVAIKLFPAAARALEQGLALAHVHWQVWSDPTDIAALVVLPAAWWLTSPRVGTTQAARGTDRWLVIAGAVACLATSPPLPTSVSLDLTLINRARGAHQLALYATDSPLDCAAIEAGDLGSLSTATFTRESCAELAPGEELHLGSIIHVNKDGAAPLDAGAGCSAVVIRAAGLADMVLTWPAIAPETTDALAAELYLEEAGSQLYVAGSDYVGAAPAAFTLPASGCPGAP